MAKNDEWSSCSQASTCKACKGVVFHNADLTKFRCQNENCEDFNKIKAPGEIINDSIRVKLYNSYHESQFCSLDDED